MDPHVACCRSSLKYPSWKGKNIPTFQSREAKVTPLNRSGFQERPQPASNVMTPYNRGRKICCILRATAVAISITLAPSLSSADSKEAPKARYGDPADESRLRFTPLNLSDGSKLTVISPTKWSDVTKQILKTLNDTHHEFTTLFAQIPPFSTSVRLMEESTFFELTGAPSWTNAMFFRGQIIIPLSSSKSVDLENLVRSVKHEYTHAIMSSLSGGKLPGWLDEGIAQWFEGSETPSLREALRLWLRENDPVPLSLLQGGFTKLKPEMVPAAYAQSLLATRALADKFGFAAIGRFFLLLREGVEKEAAFHTAFDVSQATFEKELGKALKLWAMSEEQKKG